ncbi:MAG: PilZ domain-containing protein [Chitinispirillaceae bacterium]
MKERRIQPRIRLKASAQIAVRNHTIKCVSCENISEGGMCVVVKETPPLHGHGIIEVSIKNRRMKASFSSPCHFLWHRPISPNGKNHYLGIRFTETDEANQQKISTILASLTP